MLDELTEAYVIRDQLRVAYADDPHASACEVIAVFDVELKMNNEEIEGTEEMEDEMEDEIEDEESCNDDQFVQNPMLDGVIRYLNTDLDLRSAEDLTPLAEVFKSYGMWQNHLIQEEDGNWFAIFELGCGGAEPEQTITMLLDVIEALAPEYKAIWSRCTVKEFNLGYQCGTEPRPFTQGVSSDVVTRMAAVNASLCITLYPDYAQIAKQATALEPKERDTDET